MLQKAFQAAADSFVWSKRGLLRATEMQTSDDVLGLDRKGKLSWSSFSKIRKKRSLLIRVLSDSTELVVGHSCGIFTVSGLKRACELKANDLIETVTLTSEIRKQLDSCCTLSYADTTQGPVAIDEDLAYLLGVQISAKTRTEDQLTIDCVRIENLKTISGLFIKTLDDRVLSNKISHIPRTTRIRIRSKAFSDISTDITRDFIPPFIRKSSPIVLRRFLSGVLDTIVRINPYESPSTYFSTREEECHFRRFIFSMLRLFSIIPVKSYVSQPVKNHHYVNSFVRTCDLKTLGLCFHWIGEPENSIDNQHQPTGYSQIRSMTSLSGESLVLTPSKSHWSVIVDLTPLQPQILD